MRRGLDLEKAEAAMKRAAEKAVHGTPEERAGRFEMRDQKHLPRGETSAGKPGAGTNQ